MVKANLDDQESLKAVMEGAYAVFAVTNFFESNDPEKETQQVCGEGSCQSLVSETIIIPDSVRKKLLRHLQISSVSYRAASIIIRNTGRDSLGDFYSPWLWIATEAGG